jgi:predicted porin
MQESCIMKKTLITTAVAAGLLATGAAQADPTVYGILHLSINSLGDKIYDAGAVDTNDGFDMTSNTSAIGVKGSEDLGGGLKAIYKAEFRIDPFSSDPSGGSLQRRDIWIGLKGGWGKVAAGTMSSNYKQMGGKIDPLYRTQVEARGVLNMQSGLHGGASNDGGRMTQALQYTTPKMAGIEIVLNTSVANKDGQQTATLSNDESIGAGIRWSNKSWLLYADYFDPNAGSVGAFGAVPSGAGKDESVAKIGGKWSNKDFQVGAQYEATEDQLGGDYMYLSGLWNINQKNMVTLSYGQQDKISTGYNLGYVFSMSKQTNVYVAYGFVEADSCTTAACSYDLGEKDAAGTPSDDNTLVSLGIRKSF